MPIRTAGPLAVLVVLAALGAALWWWRSDCGAAAPSGGGATSGAGSVASPTNSLGAADDGSVADASGRTDEAADEEAESEEDDSSDESGPTDPEEIRAAEEERLVEAFDEATDGWMDPAEKGVSMQDVASFAEAFNRVPKDRKEECLQRALNLVPDENVMLLAGLLMDKRQDKELVELIFNDVLNRDENVKRPILDEIYRDKTHPCWSDAAWILDVTGDKEKAE